MARELSSTLDNTIDNATAYRFLMEATLEPSYIYIDSIDNDNPFTSPDPIGVTDNPLPQDISISPTSGSLVTWINDGGTLKYMKQGSSSVFSTGLTISGKPGAYGDYVYTADGTNVVKRTVDWSEVGSGGSNPFSGSSTLGAHGGTVSAVHGVGDNQCVAVLYDDGGFRAQAWDGSNSYNQDGRFMFPKAIDYTGYTASGQERTALSLATYSGAINFGGDIYVYLSNPYNGSVEGIRWDSSSKLWSDIFLAVATDLRSSLCEFRACNAYARNGTAYLVGQFRRTENVGTNSTYTMVLSSSDGKTFSLDGFTLVSQLGYRFLAAVGEGRLFVANSNRVSSDLLTYVFDGTSGSGGLIMDIPMQDFISFRESDVSNASLRLKAGDDYYAYHSYVREGNRVKLYFGYDTSAGEELVHYGTYIVENIINLTEQGRRSIELSLIHYSQWKLTGLSSPFYNEFFAKSSVYDDCGEDSGNLYVAPNANDYRNNLSIDFWGHEAYSNSSTDPPIVGIDLMEDGGVTHAQIVGTHCRGVKSKDLKEAMEIVDYPEVTSGSPQLKVYGWSHKALFGGTVNDIVEIILFVKHADGTDEVMISDEGMKWPNTFPGGYVANDGHPLVFNLTSGSLVVGDKLTAVGLSFEGTKTMFCPGRVDLTDGWKVQLTTKDPNTPWEYDAGWLKVPKPLRPYIMFSQKPYDAWNSFQTGRFKNDCSGGVGTYPLANGLVCLAMDGGSYIVGRYNKNVDEWEIAKVRAGYDTVLASGSPSGTVPDEHVMGFCHKDGRFSVWWQKDGILQEELSYEWQASDGWMFESSTISKKCGIYGNISGPHFRTTGVNYSKKPGEFCTCDGIPYLPGWDVSEFPSSGQVQIDDNVFSYTSKVDVDPVIGPHQLLDYKQYDPPYSIGLLGLEWRYFEWTRGWFTDQGRLIAVDNGGNYEITRSDFHIWISFDGSFDWKPYKARHYSINDKIAASTKLLANKVWLTGGLKNVSLIDGESARHRTGSKVILKSDGDIRIDWYKVASGNEELTIRDLIHKISEYSGARAEFPGDITITSASPGADTLYKIGTYSYVEGIDLSVQVDDLGIDENVEVVVDCAINDSSGSMASLKVTKTASNTYKAELIDLPSTTIESVKFTMSSPDELPIRAVFHDDFVTLDVGGAWVYTFAVESIAYVTSCDVYVRSNASIEFSNILLGELSDWREAVYIDLETDGNAALGSVIQERPIEVCYESNGSISYWYERTRDRITQVVEPRSHSRRRVYPRNCASDAIVYFRDVAALQNAAFASRYGFSTKVYRMPNLDVGAIRAANILMTRVLEQAIQHRLRIRPDLRIEVGDVLDVDFTASGTQKNIAMGVIIEQVSIAYEANNANPYMDVQGREEL